MTFHSQLFAHTHSCAECNNHGRLQVSAWLVVFTAVRACSNGEAQLNVSCLLSHTNQSLAMELEMKEISNAQGNLQS